ncbi:hypothetical protein [Atopobacter phocae]|uniref:hypothetical protein n=1 Tax=Atopobacter phocae TaxID=136492 RepID=UPI0004720696|nr:hypothetical protein [Atopobacter phocae]
MQVRQSQLFEQLQALDQTSTHYMERALLVEIEQILLEQEKRLQQAQGELDAYLWAHDTSLE